MYWSACYNANLWQIRYNLQKDTIADMLPSLPIFCLFAAVPFFQGHGDRPVWSPNPPAYQQDGQRAVQPKNEPPPAIPTADVRPAARPAETAARTLQPQGILEAAVRALESHGTISARIRQQVKLFDNKLDGSGSYWELRQAGVPRIRLELQIQMDDQVSSLLQVCDGKTLWSYRKLQDQGMLTKLDAVPRHPALQQAAAMPNRNHASLLPGLGGMSKLLRGLDANFRFTKVQSGRLGTLPVWQLEGGWQTAQLVRLLPKQKDAIEQGKPVDLRRLPPYLPDRVVVLLGQADRFPRRIEYRRGTAKPEAAAAAEADRALVTMNFDDVTFDEPIDPARFFYNPGNVEAVDETKSFLQGLGVKE